MVETDVDSYFYHNTSEIALIDNQIVPVSKGSNMKKFAFKLFQFRNLKNHPKLLLEDKVSVSIKELAAILNTLRQFFKQNAKTVTFPAWYFLPKPKQEIGFTLFKNELFPHYFQDIKEQCNRQMNLSLRFERNKKCCLSIKKFQIVGEQNSLTEITKLRHCEVYRLYKICYSFATKCGNFDSNYDMWLKHSCSGNLPKSK